MIYTDHEQAELECRLNNRHSRANGLPENWKPVRIVHVFGERYGDPYEDEAWQPQRVVESDHDETAMRARRTQYHAEAPDFQPSDNWPD